MYGFYYTSVCLEYMQIIWYDLKVFERSEKTCNIFKLSKAMLLSKSDFLRRHACVQLSKVFTIG